MKSATSNLAGRQGDPVDYSKRQWSAGTGRRRDFIPVRWPDGSYRTMREINRIAAHAAMRVADGDIEAAAFQLDITLKELIALLKEGQDARCRPPRCGACGEPLQHSGPCTCQTQRI